MPHRFASAFGDHVAAAELASADGLRLGSRANTIYDRELHVFAT
jgi:hypothetical protein